MEPSSQMFNFTVPCSTIPPATSRADLKYGPVGSPPMYVGGNLGRFSPARSYWNATVPGGLKDVTRATRWTTTAPSKWRVHAYHPDAWGNWGFAVADYDAGTDTMTFARGGNQEARGGGNRMGARYFGGMLEELDSHGEFFYDRPGNRLHWSPPANFGVPSTATKLVVARLDRLIEVTGTSLQTPATDIALAGLTMQHTVPTFCCEYPYESVSGGDWSIHRGGMVFFENSTNSQLAGCLLDAPGGNGVFLNGHNRGLQIVRNEVRNAGDSLIAAVGITREMDGRALTYPWNNTFSYNHLHDWGVWGKQSSAFFAGMTRELIFDHNVVYNGPRAGMCVHCLYKSVPLAYGVA